MQGEELPLVDIRSSSMISSLQSNSNIQEIVPEIKKNMDINDRIANPNLIENKCSEYEDARTLEKIVADLRVKDEVDGPVNPQAKELLHMFIQDLKEYDTMFLKEYLDVLQNNNQIAIKNISNRIMVSIEEVVKQQSMSEKKWPENVLVMLLIWLCVSVLCLTDPQVPPPFRVFGELLVFTTEKVRVRVASACWRLLSAAQLVELADAVAAATVSSASSHGPEPSLADLLLRAVLSRLQTDRSEPEEPQWALGALRGNELTEYVTTLWAAASGGERSLLTRVFMRACAAGSLRLPTGALGDAVRGRPETLKVLIDVSKFVLLFEDDGQTAWTPDGTNRPEMSH